MRVRHHAALDQLGLREGVDEREQVTVEDVAIAKTRMESGIQQGWNETFILHVSDPACGIRASPIRFKVQWVDTRQHYTMNFQACEVGTHGKLRRKWRNFLCAIRGGTSNATSTTFLLRNER